MTTHSPIVLAQLNSLLFQQTEEISVFGLRSGLVESLIDNETGLVMASEMDDAAADVDAEFDALLNGEGK